MATQEGWWDREYEPKWEQRFGDKGMWEALVSSGGRCVYCGVDGTSDARLLAGFHTDHLVPDGTQAGLNLVFACALCNTLKANYYPSEGGGAPKDESTRERLILVAKKKIEEQAKGAHAARYWRVLHLCMLGRRTQDA